MNDVQVDFSSMMMVKPRTFPIRRSFENGIWVQYKTSPHQLQLHAKINRLQVGQGHSSPSREQAAARSNVTSVVIMFGFVTRWFTLTSCISIFNATQLQVKATTLQHDVDQLLEIKIKTTVINHDL